jgi:hypothetical protein
VTGVIATIPWTEGDGAGPWSMVDQASYPFEGSNLGRSIWIQRLIIEGVRAAAATGSTDGAYGGGVAGGLLEWCSGGQMLTANGL